MTLAFDTKRNRFMVADRPFLRQCAKGHRYGTQGLRIELGLEPGQRRLRNALGPECAAPLLHREDSALRGRRRRAKGGRRTSLAPARRPRLSSWRLVPSSPAASANRDQWYLRHFQGVHQAQRADRAVEPVAWYSAEDPTR